MLQVSDSVIGLTSGPLVMAVKHHASEVMLWPIPTYSHTSTTPAQSKHQLLHSSRFAALYQEACTAAVKTASAGADV